MPAKDQKITLSRETLQTIYSIYVEGDDLYGASASTVAAVRALEAVLGVEADED